MEAAVTVGIFYSTLNCFRTYLSQNIHLVTSCCSNGPRRGSKWIEKLTFSFLSLETSGFLVSRWVQVSLHVHLRRGTRPMIRQAVGGVRGKTAEQGVGMFPV